MWAAVGREYVWCGANERVLNKEHASMRDGMVRRGARRADLVAMDGIALLLLLWNDGHMLWMYGR